MHCAGDDLFADAGLAGDEHRGGGRGDDLHCLQRLAHGRALGDDLRGALILGVGAVRAHAPDLMDLLFHPTPQLGGGRLADDAPVVVVVLVSGLVAGPVGVCVDADLAAVVARGDAPAQFHLGIAEVARRDAAEDTRGHAAELGCLLDHIAEGTTAVDHPHRARVTGGAGEVAADLVLDAQDEVGVLVQIDGAVQALLTAARLFEAGAGGKADVLDMVQFVLALGAAEPFGRPQALYCEGLQEGDGGQLRRGWLVHGQSPLTHWASVGGATA